MSDLVPVGTRDLIFEPTETLSARIISAVEEKKDAEGRLKDLEAALHRERRKKTGANLRSMAFLGMAAAAAAGAFFIWSGTEGQIVKADQERDAAFDARDTAIEDLRDAETTIENQLGKIEGFDQFLEVADLSMQVRRLNTELTGYETQYVSKSTRGLDKSNSFDLQLENEEQNWMDDQKRLLEAQETRLEGAIGVFNQWLDIRQETPPIEVCLPDNPFRDTPRQANCPN